MKYREVARKILKHRQVARKGYELSWRESVEDNLCRACEKRHECPIYRNVVKTLNENDFVGIFAIKKCKCFRKQLPVGQWRKDHLLGRYN